MNNARRLQISKAKMLLKSSIDILNAVSNEEQDSFDNLSEGLQQTRRGEQMEYNVDCIQEAVDKIQESIDSLDEVM